MIHHMIFNGQNGQVTKSGHLWTTTQAGENMKWLTF